MHFKFWIPITAFLLLESAQARYQCYDDTYDDLPAGITAVQSPVGVYHGLSYSAFNVAVANSTTGPLAPHTPPNAVVSSAANSLDLTLLSAAGAISTTGSTKSFDLKSFYLSCTTLAGTGEASVPVDCSVAVNAYYINGAQASVATYGYAPNKAVQAAPFFAQLPSTYVGLKNATFIVVGSSETVASTVLQVDDIIHCNTY